jgi:uncharacterized membrane protein
MVTTANVTEAGRNARAWIVFVAITFGLLNAGVGHDRERELERRSSLGVADAVSVVRLLYTDSGDPRRYFAYARAALGRSYEGYFVRSEQAWRDEFHEGRERDPDLVPEVVPSRPLEPYRDFAVEYPPLFFPLVVPLAAVTDDPDVFRFAFGIEMAIALALSLRVGLGLARRLDAPLGRARLVEVMSASALLLGVVITHRFDACVGLLVICAVAATSADRPGWAGAALGAAIGLKLVPLIIAPILAMRWLAERRWRFLARYLVVTFLITAATLGPLLLLGSDGLVELVRYHASRPLQVESIWAAALRLLSSVDGSDLAVVHSYGSINAVGTHTALALVLAVVATIAGLAIVIVLAWRRVRDAGDERGRLLAIARGTIAALAAFMSLGKVFSPQYLVWILPLGVVVAVIEGKRSAITWGAILLLSQVIYPVGNPALEDGRAWVAALVLLRDGLLLYWAISPLRRRASRPA